MIHVDDMLQKKRKGTKKNSSVISSCTSSSVLFEVKSYMWSKTVCASTNMRSQRLNILLQREKNKEAKRQMQSQRTGNSRPGSNGSCK